MKNKRGMLLIVAGILLIGASLALCVYNIWDEARAAGEVQTVVKQLQEKTESKEPPVIPAYVLTSDPEMPVEWIDNQDYIGILEIPSLELKLPVLNHWSYPALKQAPCRYKGSAYRDDLIIAAHNYNSHFGLLKNLEGGESVIFTDMEGNVFYYEVILTEILTSTAIEEMEEDGWALTLFTCTMGGQNRVTVRCDRVDKNEL